MKRFRCSERRLVLFGQFVRRHEARVMPGLAVLFAWIPETDNQDRYETYVQNGFNLGIMQFGDGWLKELVHNRRFFRDDDQPREIVRTINARIGATQCSHTSVCIETVFLSDDRRRNIGSLAAPALPFRFSHTPDTSLIAMKSWKRS